MGCRVFKELLSGYIDNMLEADEKLALEQHLLSCKACSLELATLRKCIREIDSLEKVKAPDDFLKNVRERIERRSEFDKMTSKLYQPLKLKVPLEFAGVLVTVILIVAVWRYIKPEEKVFYVTKAKIQETSGAIQGDSVNALKTESLNYANQPMQFNLKGVPADNLALFGSFAGGNIQERQLTTQEMKILSKAEPKTTAPILSGLNINASQDKTKFDIDRSIADKDTFTASGDSRQYELNQLSRAASKASAGPESLAVFPTGKEEDRISRRASITASKQALDWDDTATTLADANQKTKTSQNFVMEGLGQSDKRVSYQKRKAKVGWNESVETVSGTESIKKTDTIELTLLIDESKLSVNGSIAKIKDALDPLKGSIIDQEVQGDPQARVIRIKLPAGNYFSFLEKIKEFSLVVQLASITPAKDDKILDLRIQIKPTK